MSLCLIFCCAWFFSVPHQEVGWHGAVTGNLMVPSCSSRYPPFPVLLAPSGLTSRIPQTVYRYFRAHPSFYFFFFPLFTFWFRAYVSFWAHVKIASHIVSYRIDFLLMTWRWCFYSSSANVDSWSVGWAALTRSNRRKSRRIWRDENEIVRAHRVGWFTSLADVSVYRRSTVVSATCKYDEPMLKMSHEQGRPQDFG